MSETTALPSPALPLFFHSVVGVTPEQHGELRLDRTSGFAFAAKTQAIPLGLGELNIVCQHYPIVFTVGPQPTLVALLGLTREQNAFVQPDGTWRPDSYVPAYARAFPFIFVEDAAKKTLFVGMDPDARAISKTTGDMMFEDSKPSKTLGEAINFCAAFRDSIGAANAFGLAMEEAGMLEEEEATINFTTGGSSRVTGFKVFKADRLVNLDDATYLDWRHRGWIAAIYAHLYSAPRWGKLVELTTAA